MQHRAIHSHEYLGEHLSVLGTIKVRAMETTQTSLGKVPSWGFARPRRPKQLARRGRWLICVSDHPRQPLRGLCRDGCVGVPLLRLCVPPHCMGQGSRFWEGVIFFVQLTDLGRLPSCAPTLYHVQDTRLRYQLQSRRICELACFVHTKWRHCSILEAVCCHRFRSQAYPHDMPWRYRNVPNRKPGPKCRHWTRANLRRKNCA